MLRFLLLACLLALSTAFMAPVMPSKISQSKVVMNEEGKGFGGGEATRDPEPTEIDPNDPKGKQQAIHKAESFAEYLAKRSSAYARVCTFGWGIGEMMGNKRGVIAGRRMGMRVMCTRAGRASAA